MRRWADARLAGRRFDLGQVLTYHASALLPIPSAPSQRRLPYRSGAHTPSPYRVHLSEFPVLIFTRTLLFPPCICPVSRTFASVLNFIGRMRQYHTRSYQYDQVRPVDV